MIETYLLKHLVELAKNKTLSDAAKNLFLTQSALSRSMQKLEKILGVELFVRKKNSIALNDNGIFAAKLAENILLEIQDYVEKVRDFDRKNRTVRVGSCAPIPLNQFSFLFTQLFPEIALVSELNVDEELLRGLQEDYFNFVILHKNFEGDNFFSKKFGSEKLFLAVPKSHKFADKTGIFLEELNGEKILLYSKIGFWYELCKEKAPHAKFLLQTNREIFNDLVDSAAFLSFTTDIFIKNNRTPKNCVCKPILNAEGDVNYYCVCKVTQKNRFKNLFASLSSQNFMDEKIFSFI